MRSAESNLEDRSRPLAAPVELRIHAVGGTTPEILLGHPHPVQVAGDDTAGFYRPPDSDSLEAYSWGGITSRSGPPRAHRRKVDQPLQKDGSGQWPGIHGKGRRTLSGSRDDHREPGDPLPPVKGHAFYAGSKGYADALTYLNRQDVT